MSIVDFSFSEGFKVRRSKSIANEDGIQSTDSHTLGIMSPKPFCHHVKGLEMRRRKCLTSFPTKCTDRCFAVAYKTSSKNPKSRRRFSYLAFSNELSSNLTTAAIIATSVAERCLNSNYRKSAMYSIR